MPFTQGEVVVRQLDPTCWALAEPVEYRGRWETWTVPAGFETDFASVPRLVVWLLPTYGLYTKSAILHDFLLAEPSVTRADADGLFRRSMGELGVSAPRRWMMWAAVRAASRMRGASRAEWVAFSAVAPPAVAFVAAPAALVQLFLWLFWVVELVAWVPRRLSEHDAPPRPRFQGRTA